MLSFSPTQIGANFCLGLLHRMLRKNNMKLLVIGSLLTISVLFYSHLPASTGCDLVTHTLEHVIDDDDSTCTIQLGNQTYCNVSSSSTNSSCVSATLPYYGSVFHHSKEHCRISNQTLITGTITSSTIQDTCSSYSGGDLHYKYYNATKCECSGPGALET